MSFPDVQGCYTQGDTLQEAIYMAKDALKLHLFGIEADSCNMPKPSAPENIDLSKYEKIETVNPLSPVQIWVSPANSAFNRVVGFFNGILCPVFVV